MLYFDEKMKKNAAELVFILDMSGSMQPLTESTIDGYNSLLDKRRQTGEDITVTTVVFNDQAVYLCRRVPIASVPNLSAADYRPRRCTALIDSVVTTLDDICNDLFALDGEDQPEIKACFITTDGLENASTRYTVSTMRRKIEYMTESMGWEFFFLGANMDAVREAGRYGIRRQRAVTYENTPAGNSGKFRMMDNAVTVLYKREENYDDETWKDIFDKKGETSR